MAFVRVAIVNRFGLLDAVPLKLCAVCVCGDFLKSSFHTFSEFWCAYQRTTNTQTITKSGREKTMICQRRIGLRVK